MIIPIKCPSLNANYAGRHWTARRTEANNIHTIVIAECRKQHVQSATEFPLDVVIIAKFKDNRRRDAGNCSNKEIIDGLVIAGIFPDDNLKYIRSVMVVGINNTGKDEVDIKWSRSCETRP
jgi:Holliday junction resolvase RusA-like endonuclease